MQDFIVSYGLAHDSADAGGHARLKRLTAMLMAVFELGKTWHGSQSAIFLRSEQSIDEVTARLAWLLSEGDFLLVMSLTAPPDVRYAGRLKDAETFHDLYPQAREIRAMTPQ
ncbi:hypothetical protein QO010_004735 [Caulobacter ginsengisoli]|uniref:Uncharacterized protein n=1 Tax=Caulobacter ginsengisoli TaxID=400775 RepID=A0ABU0IY48_9CAUL|nr:hypothetical protein [Caulobacter ginsengisoli]MDQ0466938.1 hypothetical protein [Caulobacter ginsengisoli]